MLIGGNGFGSLWSDAGNDIFVFGGGTPAPGARGGLALDVIFDFDVNGGDLLDFGSGTVLRWETFGNINAAEKRLGVDLDAAAAFDAGYGAQSSNMATTQPLHQSDVVMA